MRVYLNNNLENFLNEKKRVVGPRKTAKLLLKHSNLQFSKYYSQFDSYYVYDEANHIYVLYNKPAFIIIVTNVLSLLDHEPLAEYTYVRQVVENLSTFSSHAFIGVPRIDDHILVFDNCLYNLNTKKTEDFNPKYLVVYNHSFDYVESEGMPHFDQYLNDLCEGYDDRKQFIRAFLYIVLYGPGRHQLFFHIYGLSGTGKSTLSNLCQCLVGKNLCVTSSLKRLSGDQFEVANLANKKLILISENENWTTESSILKMISGGDPLAGRIKHLQGSFEINVIGVLAIFNNFKFEVRDDTGAISRRIKQFRADNAVQVKKDLLRYSPKFQWEGLLVKEIPNILNWVISISRSEVDSILDNMEKKVPSLAKEVVDSKLSFNPIYKWITEEVIPGEGAYLGVQAEKNIKNTLESKTRKTLYPAYHNWCNREGISPLSKMRFTNSLMNGLRQANLKAVETRRSAGIYVSGIELDPKIFNRDYIYGGSIFMGNEEISEEESSNYIPGKSKIISANLREKYMSLMGGTVIKETLNKECSSKMNLERNPFLLNELLDDYMESKKLEDETFKESVREQIRRGIEILSKKGGIPFKWKNCGTSPRILPSSYGTSINFTKKVVRNKAYEIMGDKAKELGFTIIDYDLTSCYMSILLGLYPEQLRVLQKVVQEVGLWKFIENEFIREGEQDRFNKPFVKICVYSSFFLGGEKAMRNGILKSFREDLGLTERDFKATNYYDQCDNIAVNITSFMRNSDIVLDIQSISNYIKEAHMDDYLIGPLGDKYKVTDDTFRTAYPNYLISFEICLLAQATLNLVEKYPAVQVLGHYHDGNVLLVPTEKKEEVTNYFNNQVLLIGKELGLSYPQKIEVKSEY